MSGFARPIAAAVIFIIAAASTDDATVRRGAAIYNATDTSPRWRALSADADYTYPPGTVSCASCHGEDGTGGSEGGVAAPSLAAARSMNGPDLAAWLTNAFAGRGRNGALLGDRMPRFEMTDEDLHDLAVFMRTLPLPYQQGVGADAVHIRIDLGDAALSQAAIDLLRQRGNALTGSVRLFGRKPELAVASASSAKEDAPPPFIAISWGPEAEAAAPVSVRILDESGTSSCGALLPDEERRYRLLDQWVSRRQLRSVRSSSVVTIEPGEGSSVEALGARHFDLSGSGQATGRALVPVVAGDLVDRMLSVQDLEEQTALPVHEASAVSLFLKALRVSLTSLDRSGRRLSATAVCKTIQAELARQHAITLVFPDREEVIKASDW